MTLSGFNCKTVDAAYVITVNVIKLTRLTKFQKPFNNLSRKSEKFAYCYHYDDNALSVMVWPKVITLSCVTCKSINTNIIEKKNILFRIVVRRDPICGLCEMLNSNLPAKTIRNLTAWAMDGSQCQEADKIDWLRQIT
jgi:hypothetical protein